jgi:hypothetical protein
VKQILVGAGVPRGARWSSAAADETYIARRDRAPQLAQDMTLPALARTIFNETATTMQKAIDEEARLSREGED